MATIRRVTIHRLRNVTPGCTFELHPGLNVLLGQNGTGKTTLLQWMADFMSGRVESWSREPYRVEVEAEAEAEAEAGAEPERARLRMLVDNEISELPRNPEAQRGLDDLVSRLGESPRTNLLTAKLTIEIGDQSYEIQERPNHVSLHVNGAPLMEWDTPTWSAGIPPSFLGMTAKAVLELGGSNPKGDSADQTARQRPLKHLHLLTRGLLDYAYPFYRFDESLEFFHRITGPQSSVQVEFGPASSRSYWLVPDELFLLIAGRFQGPEPGVQTLTFSSEDVQGFLATAVRLFQYRSAAVHLDLLEKDARGSRYGNLRFTFHRHDGSIIGHDALSYGQKRMLSFLYYLALHPRFVIVDELVNGLHHAWIEACIDEIGNRQGILTSQNPLLLDHMSFDSADEVRQRFILCRSERNADGREQLIWRNPTQEEAESFFRAYQAGIQHIGEILVDKGLW